MDLKRVQVSFRKTLRNYILPVFKDYLVSSITTKDLQELINKETPLHTAYGLDKIHSTLVKTFDYGIVSGYIAETPLNGLVMPQKRSIMAQTLKPSRQQKACSKELINAIFKRFPEGHPCFIPLILGYVIRCPVWERIFLHKIPSLLFADKSDCLIERKVFDYG